MSFACTKINPFLCLVFCVSPDILAQSGIELPIASDIYFPGVFAPIIQPCTQTLEGTCVFSDSVVLPLPECHLTWMYMHGSFHLV